jgi:WD40 repeat protein
MRLWDTKTGTLLQTFRDHSNDVNEVAFSPDGKYFVTASSDHTLRMYKILK